MKEKTILAQNIQTLRQKKGGHKKSFLLCVN